MAETTGQRLRRLRGKRTLREASEGMGIATSTLAMYELDLRRPKDTTKRRIAEYYGRSVNYIFFTVDAHDM